MNHTTSTTTGDGAERDQTVEPNRRRDDLDAAVRNTVGAAVSVLALAQGVPALIASWFPLPAEPAALHDAFTVFLAACLQAVTVALTAVFVVAAARGLWRFARRRDPGS